MRRRGEFPFVSLEANISTSVFCSQYTIVALPAGKRAKDTATIYSREIPVFARAFLYCGEFSYFNGKLRPKLDFL